MLMSIVLILIGAAVTYCGWRLLFRISDEKVHRRFRSWWMERMSKEDAAGFQVAVGAIFIMFVMFAGIGMVLLGLANLLGWANNVR
jgi:hypothetical protein